MGKDIRKRKGVGTLLDKAFFEQIAQNKAQTMYRVACGLLRHDADRQDAMQNALLKAWEKRHTLRDEKLFTTWLIRILINECRNIARAGQRVIPMETLPETPAPAYDMTARDLVDRLPEKQRLCVILHYLEGWPVKEVAQALKVPQATVRGRLMQARKALKLELTKEEAAYET